MNKNVLWKDLWNCKAVKLLWKNVRNRRAGRVTGKNPLSCMAGKSPLSCMVERVLREGAWSHKIARAFGRGFVAICAALIAGVWLGASNNVSKVSAADSYETTYKVIIYSGDKGTFNGTGCVSGAGTASLQGSDRIVVSGLHYGDTLNIRVSSTNGAIKLNPKDGGKYQPTGTRRSGRDNSEAFDRDNMTSPNRIFTVTCDRTFVVTYGVPGKMVPYKVSYVLKGTNKAVPGSKTDTFYGVAGEKPVVSAPYFEGYTPVYKAITGTLKKGQENSWVFEYTENEEEEPQSPQGQGDQQQPTQPTTGGDGTGTGGTTTTTTDDGDTGDAADENNEDETDDTRTVEDEETPTDLLDLDDEDVPTSNVDLEDEDKNSGKDEPEAKRLPIFAGIGIAAVVLLGVLLIVIMKKRKAMQSGADDANDADDSGDEL